MRKRKLVKHGKNAVAVLMFVTAVLAAVLFVANLLAAVTGDRLIALLLMMTLLVTLLPLFRGVGIGEVDYSPNRRRA